MDKRKKRTSTNQYQMFIEMMEKDPIFASGRVPRDGDVNHLQKKWKELSDKLNTCSSGPNLTAEEWRKRLNDWKNTTRCKYRRSISGEKDFSMTSLEMKALELFGKVPNVGVSTEQVSIHLKSEKSEPEEDLDRQRTSETFQKELQAAVEEAIGGDEEEDGLTEEPDDTEEILSDPIAGTAHNTTTSATANSVGLSNATTYRTIVVENAQFADDENNDETLEFITDRRQTMGPASSASSVGTVATGVQTVVTTTPTATVTKLINGDIPLKRLRTQPPEQIIYEVKKTPINQQHSHRNITIQSTSSVPVTSTQIQQHHQLQHVPLDTVPLGITSQDVRELTRQLKRIADIKAEKLKFEIARFKFNNPGFNHINHL